MQHPLFIRFLLIIALLFTQTGGLVHGISHIAEEQDQSLVHDCELCQAYGQLSSALGSQAIDLSLPELITNVACISQQAITLPATFTAYSTRAPPHSA